MSAKFCLLIPSKVLQVEKHFSEKLYLWVTKYQNTGGSNLGLSGYSLYSLAEFQKRQDVYLDLPNNIYNRYHVIDWRFYFMPPALLISFLSWLAKVYGYGEVGVLKYWADELRRFPTITISNIEASISDLSAGD